MRTGLNRVWGRGTTLALHVAAAGVLAASGFGLAMAGERPEPKPVLLSIERDDVDGDGTIDVVAYYDGDGDGTVDSEVIDLGNTGQADILALRCDGDGDGREDDWVVVDVATEEARAMLIDDDDDGEVDEVAYADGSREPVGGVSGLMRPARYN